MSSSARLIPSATVIGASESPDRTAFSVELATACAGDLSWFETPLDTGLRWSDRNGIPLVDTDLDVAGRVSRRTWHGGRSLDYARDERGRLTKWTETLPRADATVVHVRQYTGNELSGLVTNGARTVVRSDDGGRIRKLIGPMRTISYEYDANGWVQMARMASTNSSVI